MTASKPDRGDLSPLTRAAQALGWEEPHFRSVVPPLYISASYERSADGSYPGQHSYSRDQNPTFDQAEALIASLEGGEEALLFGSGMAAATALFEPLPSGARVAAPKHMYWTLRGWLLHLAGKGRIELLWYDHADLDGLRTACASGLDVLWIETPANPTCDVVDIEAATEIAHRAGARVFADSTVATPILCQPLSLGVDVVFHSATKQLNGHTDVLAGAVVTRDKTDEHWKSVRFERAYRGGIIGPFEAWLLLRGMRTVGLRVRHTAQTARRIAEFLSKHSLVVETFYAGLEQHPGHAIAKKQMTGGFGCLVSFRPVGGAKRAVDVKNRMRLFRDATSLGGVESLVEHRAPVEGEGTPVPDDLLRLSIGIEEAVDLIADLEQALG